MRRYYIYKIIIQSMNILHDSRNTIIVQFPTDRYRELAIRRNTFSKNLQEIENDSKEKNNLNI